MSSASRHTLPHHHPLPAVSPCTGLQNSEKEYSPQRLHFGLLSPNASFSSLSSSASSPHHAPRTPLRSVYQQHQRPASPARPSPLFRLLLPPSPLPAQTSRPSSPTTMALHQPAPLYSHPVSPMTSPRPLATGPSTRPPSRSERLLRGALLKDDIERNVAPTVSPTTSPSTKGHRRRHSHVPTSNAVHTEDYTRGSYLFRTPMTNPRSPSPASSSGGGATQYVMYGGDAEGHPSIAPQRRALSPVSNTRSRRSGFSPTRDVSPSPMRRRHEGSQQRPSPLPLDAHSSGLQRHHTIHTSPRTSGRVSQQESPPVSRQPRSPHGQSTPPRGEPLVMTPHEQVLRARLEKVLNSSKVADGKQRGRRTEHRSQSGSRRSNEVMDEEGSWPWKDRELAMKSGGSLASPLQSSNSGSSLSQSSSHAQFATFATGIQRARSKTDPTPPTLPTHRNRVPSPRRSTTAPSGVASPLQHGKKPSVQHTGTTPPLVSDSSPLLGPAAGDDDEADLRLLTPPPTPPCTSNAFTFNGNNVAIRQDGYCPSPYKMGFPAHVSAYATTRRGPPQVQGATRLGSARRPANAPLGDRYSSRSSERQHPNHGDDCDDERSSSCSSRSYPASDDFFAQMSPSVDLSPRLEEAMRPQFNARKASAQCRAMEGYVSFANVEGLGMPPDDPAAAPHHHHHGDGRRRGEHERGRSMFAWGVGGFRKLLGVGQGESGDRELPPQPNADGVVV